MLFMCAFGVLLVVIAAGTVLTWRLTRREAEMAQLSVEDAQAFREDLGLREPGLDRVIRTSYELLGLISFLIAGEDECRV
jgi:ribosome-binding ATPase YchF (GTP1/OBG family)